MKRILVVEDEASIRELVALNLKMTDISQTQAGCKAKSRRNPLWISRSFKAIPHNSKCRYGERGATDAKPKAQIILDAAKVSAASGGNSG